MLDDWATVVYISELGSQSVHTRFAAEVVGPSGAAIGIDLAPKMIVIARNKAAFLSSRAELKLAAIEDLPYADGSFDVVLSILMLHHLPPRREFANC